MKRPFPARRSSSTADRGSHKRQKRYSTRIVPWEEQKTLGGRFVEVGRDQWPVKKIVAEKRVGGRIRYQIEWEAHPTTHEEYQPEWLSHNEVADDLISEWQKEKLPRKAKPSLPPQQEETTSRYTRNRRVLLDSSSSPVVLPAQQSDAPASPPSLASGSSDSALEIAETQERAPVETFAVNLPPAPSDKGEYDTIRTSQLSPSTAHFELDRHLLVAGSPSNSDPSGQTSQPALTSGSIVIPEALHNSQPPVESSCSRDQPTKLKLKLILQPDTVINPVQGSRATESHLSSQSTPFITQPSLALGSSESYINSSQSVPSNPPTYPLAASESRFQDTQTQTQTTNPQIHATPPGLTPVDALSPSSVLESPKIKGRANRSSSVSSGIVTPLSESSRKHRGRRSRKRSTVIPGSDSNLSPRAQPTMTDHEREVRMLELHADVSRSPLVNSMIPDDIPSDAALFDHSDHNVNIGAPSIEVTPLIVHESIEGNSPSPVEASQLSDSKTNSSQESLNNAREIQTFDGIMIPTLPILGKNEYAVGLPAEGKIKSAYDEVIKLKKKAILRFISRKGAPGTAEISSKKTTERNEMQDLIGRLNNIVTHTDLGLPMTQTQHVLNAEQSQEYAEYAGSKFLLLGYLMEKLRNDNVAIVIFSQEGSLQDMLEEYLTMKRIPTRRHDQKVLDTTHTDTPGLSIDLFATQSNKQVTLMQKPTLIIAFDVSFTRSDPQVQSLLQQYGDELPILHFLIPNSSEHVERCVPESLPSNIRLKVVVRTTYLASLNLGLRACLIADPSDPSGYDHRLMDMADIQREVRKSPARRLQLMADMVGEWLSVAGDFQEWPLGSMDELKLSELEAPSRPSRAASRTPQPRSTRIQSPASRATTPSGRKRMLDLDTEIGPKRLRLTPVADVIEETQTSQPVSNELQKARSQIAQMTMDLASARTALMNAEAKQMAADVKAEEWRESHASLLRRYEQERLKHKELHKENKKLTATIGSLRTRDESVRMEKASFRDQLVEMKTELAQVRAGIKVGGGTMAQLEDAREEAREATKRALLLEKTLKSTKGDFEFLSTRYQEASQQGSNLASELKDLESQAEKLKLAADDSKRSLKSMNYQMSLSRAMDKAEQFRLEVKNREAVIKKLQEENITLKSRRGVQTRGSSVQPAPSPGPRSRQASPAPGHLMPPSGSRASVLRHGR